MTEKMLESYIGIRREIEQLEGYLQGGAPQTADVVQSAAEWPYSQHSVVVLGSDTKLYNMWEKQLEKNRQTAKDIENFVESVSDERIRLAMRYRYFDGLTWQAVAMRCGWQKRDTPRERIKKYLCGALRAKKGCIIETDK